MLTLFSFLFLFIFYRSYRASTTSHSTHRCFVSHLYFHLVFGCKIRFQSHIIIIILKSSPKTSFFLAHCWLGIGCSALPYSSRSLYFITHFYLNLLLLCVIRHTINVVIPKNINRFKVLIVIGSLHFYRDNPNHLFPFWTTFLCFSGESLIRPI